MILLRATVFPFIMVTKLFPPAILGDFRMVIGEDKSKVANIVQDNMQHFRILYTNILQDCPQVVYKPQQGKLEVRYMHMSHRKANAGRFAVISGLVVVA